MVGQTWMGLHSSHVVWVMKTTINIVEFGRVYFCATIGPLHVLFQMDFDFAVCIGGCTSSHQCITTTSWTKFELHLLCDTTLVSFRHRGVLETSMTT